MLYLIIGESMDNGVFVNDAFTYAVNEYLNCRRNKEGIKTNSFFVVVIRLLSIIYDELDIIGPFFNKNEKLLKDNLGKYSLSEEQINAFFNYLNNYYKMPNEDDFIKIQKMIIDMFIKKKLCIDLSTEEIKMFKDLLYSPYSASPLMVSFNFKMTSNVFEVLNYFEKELKENVKVVVERPKETLNFDAYKVLNYSLDDINNMTADELDIINKQVYNHFEINNNAINKDYLLDKAVYDLNHPKPSFSTGNGYVDILFVLSMITTLGMIILLITLFLLIKMGNLIKLGLFPIE